MANDLFCCLNVTGDAASVTAFAGGRAFPQTETTWEADVRFGALAGWTVRADSPNSGPPSANVCYFCKGEINFAEVQRVSVRHPDLVSP